MWSPTSIIGVSNRCSGIRRSQIRFIAALPLLLLLAACSGYQLGADSPSIFGNGSKTLKVKGVDYPTLQPWLPYALRSSLRDEVGARKLASWVDDGPADFEIQIKVISYTTREWVRSEGDTTLLYDSQLTVEAIVYDGSNNKEVWRSGPVSYDDRVESATDPSAPVDIITQVMRQLVDRMRNAF